MPRSPTHEFELTFFEGSGMGLDYERYHDTFEAAEACALSVLSGMPDRSAHPAIIYGPGLGPLGRLIQ